MLKVSIRFLCTRTFTLFIVITAKRSSPAIQSAVSCPYSRPILHQSRDAHVPIS